MFPKMLLLAALMWLNLSVCSCRQKTGSLTAVKFLKNYPSGSALAFINDRLYLMGDDASGIWVLDENLDVVDSIRIIDTAIRRIPKQIKADFEAMAVMGNNKNFSLLLVGSGSLPPHRNFCVLVDPRIKQKTLYDVSGFYKRLQESGVKEINIEGAAALPGGIVLASRGNKNYPWNHLVFTDESFLNRQDSAFIRIVRVGINTDTSYFRGVSGLDYAAKSDKLLLTVSTENTYNSYTDGSIGKSYLWIINDITVKKRISNINPDRVIDLETLDARFKGQKVESVCVLEETRQQLQLVLTADNDNGQTTLFNLQIKK